MSYALAVGHNNASALVALNAQTPPIVVRGRGRYAVGEQVTVLSGDVVGLGRPSVVWLVGALLPDQYNWLRTTFCAGGWSGRVTARTRLDSNTFVIGNAMLVVPYSATLSQRLGRFENVELLLADWEQI